MTSLDIFGIIVIFSIVYSLIVDYKNGNGLFKGK